MPCFLILYDKLLQTEAYKRNTCLRTIPQLWFYPDGLPDSLPGFCSLKLVSRPGWHLPFPIKLWIRGTAAFPHFQQEAEQQLLLQQDKTKGKGKGQKRVKEASVASPLLSKPSMVSVGPIWRESADYVAYSRSFCRSVSSREATNIRTYICCVVYSHSQLTPLAEGRTIPANTLASNQSNGRIIVSSLPRLIASVPCASSAGC